MKNAIQKIFRLGDIQAILIILSSFLLNWYAAVRLESSSLPAIAVYLYALYGFVVLIVKSGEWIPEAKVPGFKAGKTLKTAVADE